MKIQKSGTGSNFWWKENPKCLGLPLFSICSLETWKKILNCSGLKAVIGEWMERWTGKLERSNRTSCLNRDVVNTNQNEKLYYFYLKTVNCY